MDMIMCMIFELGLGKEFWGPAALTAAHIITHLPSSTHENKTLYQRWFGQPPSIGHLRVFGCTAYRHIPIQTRRKLDPGADKCRMIGYQEDSRSRVYCLYDEGTKQVFSTRDIVFDETTTQETPKKTLAENDKRGHK